ncbi:MAG: hypothetical protein Satyrvirus1_28 [Satyrvirus sp.]|uniref:Exo-alpha-sialidase n=1 Tax=Satyrvirus sp. TaxID=2487771 RepID=A0A3G5ACQ9_9VIRU|nr:MAG: hypothetical protein Satyrvirus1_28 [Satyrvirus sp.]
MHTCNCNRCCYKSFINTKLTLQHKNVGYNLSNDPVPDNLTCLVSQEIYGTTTTIYYGAAVEPTIAVNPYDRKNIVTSWQNDRINNGGSLEAGIAYTFNGGHTWYHTVVPFQVCIGGLFQRISDVWLSWSVSGRELYLVALLFNVNLVGSIDQPQMAIGVSVSHDGGAHWDKPFLVAKSLFYENQLPPFPPNSFFLDKCAITADPNNSEFAYTVWDSFDSPISSHSSTFMSRTSDRGTTWFPPSLVYDPAADPTLPSNGNPNDNQTIGNVVVVPPILGHVINFMVRIYASPNATDLDYLSDSFPYQFTRSDISFVRSRDYGATFERIATVVASVDPNSQTVYTGGYTYDPITRQINGGIGVLCRTAGPFLADFAVNKENGHLYVVWQTGEFRSDLLPQIAIAVSRDNGVTWSRPQKINQTPNDAHNPQAFTPQVAVTKSGFIVVLYSDFRFDDMADPTNNTKTDTWLVIYQEQPGELKFIKEIRLSPTSYIMQNGPTTTQGVMTNGDYQFDVANDDQIFIIHTESLSGPFSSPILIVDDPENDAKVYLDKNLRTLPYVDILDICQINFSC